ncbi:MAG: AbrB/MazE/SpoVT family DNA-binding domain-containing protein [Alphaproteobacteria bacterium]|nr:AbrB/MazE/SpoVT family DNA-binding domain-containing protein [Alphaproteobacteria bacterium]
MRVNAGGQVTIPKEIREQAGLKPHTEVEFEVEGESVRILRARKQVSRRGERLVAHLRGRGKVLMTTVEIMRLTRGR